MSKWKEIKNNHIDEEENVVCIDAWKTTNDMEEGKVIAKVDLITKNVTYLDEAAKTDEYAQKVIKEAITNIEYKSYRFTVDYSENGEQKSFQIGTSAKEKPDSKWLAQKISNYFSMHDKRNLDTALNSVEGIDIHIQDSKGEYVDSDEVYGDDLKALFEHLKTERYKLLDECEIDEKARGLLSELYNGTLKEINSDKFEKPGLDDVISAAKQRQDNVSNKNTPVAEQER